MRVVVYASASPDTPPEFKKAAEKLGKLLAENGHECVNGGGDMGGMGALNRSCREHGGKIKVVIHSKWCVDGQQYDLGDDGVTVAVNGPDLAERKRGLLQDADAVIALPGGIGTMDEVYDVACQKQLSFKGDIPICLVNVGGYFGGLLQQLRDGREKMLISIDPDELIHSESTPEKALAYCVSYRAKASHAKEMAAEKGKVTPSSVPPSTMRIVMSISMLPVILSCYTW